MITHEQIHDKIKVFGLAGDNTGGYDYAIPDAMLEELVKMGVDNPGRWYIADCSGPCAFPKLRHIGEAVYSILNARSKANEEIIQKLLEDDGFEGICNRMICDFAGNQVCNEAEAGFVDYNMIIGLVTEAFAQGRESLFVNEKKHIMESAICEGDDTTAPYRIVLHSALSHGWVSHGWVTHIQNMQNKGYGFGNYHDSKQTAVRDFLERCLNYKLDPYV